MNKEKVYHLTAEGLKAYEDELHRLIFEERPKVVQALQEARAQGDLSENAEYDAAKDAQTELESRIQEVEYIIKNAEVISHDGNDQVVNVGKRVRIEYLDGPNAGKEVFFALLGTLEADPMDKELMKISTESPIGAAINGKKKGDKILVVINGKEFHIQIKEVE